MLFVKQELLDALAAQLERLSPGAGERAAFDAAVGALRDYVAANADVAEALRAYGLHLRRRRILDTLSGVHFAGEATATDGHPASVHGALVSGERAAQEVLDAQS